MLNPSNKKISSNKGNRTLKINKRTTKNKSHRYNKKSKKVMTKPVFSGQEIEKLRIAMNEFQDHWILVNKKFENLNELLLQLSVG